VPKKPRQAHIPRKVARKRKAPRRDAVTVPADAYIDVSGPVHVPDGMSRDPVGPIPMPAGRSRPAYPAVAPRPGSTRAAGQLPTFERAYLLEELRRIGITSVSLLGLIVVLTIVLR
jgi:hypothetical protein